MRLAINNTSDAISQLPRKIANFISILFFSSIFLFNICQSECYASNQYSSISEKKILVLYSYGDGLPAFDLINGTFLGTLKSNGMYVRNIYLEYLDLSRINKNKENEVKLYLESKYADVKFDIIVTIYRPAFSFLVQYGQNISPGAPVVSLYGPLNVDNKLVTRKTVVLPIRMDFKNTLKYALQLFPNTNRVILVNGALQGDTLYKQQAENDFKPWQGVLDFEDTTESSYPEMMFKIQTLQTKSIIIFASYFNDITGQDFVPQEVARDVSSLGTAPVFGPYESLLEVGVVGGSMYSFSNDGSRIGKIALDILKNTYQEIEALSYLPLEMSPIFDWNELQRWNIDKSKLPKNSIVYKEPLNLWDEYKGIIIACCTLMGVLVVATIVVFNLNRRRMIAIKQLRANELLMREKIAQLNLAPVLVRDMQDRICMWNDGARNLYGFSAEDVLGKISNDVLQTVYPASYVEIRDRLLEQGSWNGELRHITKEGKFIFVSSAWTIFYDEINNPLSIIEVNNDITKLKQLENTLRENEKRYRVLADNADDVIWKADDNLKIMYVSPSIERLLGVKPEEVQGRCVLDLMSSQSRLKALSVWERRLQIEATGDYSGRDLLEVETNHRDGTVIFLEVAVRRIIEDQDRPNSFIGISRDITKRKAMEFALARLLAEQDKIIEQRTYDLTLANKELLEATRKYRLVADNTYAWEFLLDTAKNYLYCSPSCLRITGHSNDEFQENPLLLEQIAHPEDKAILLRHKSELSSLQDSVCMQFRIINSNGEIRWLEHICQPLFDDDGNYLGRRGSNRDITEQKMSEDKILKESLWRGLLIDLYIHSQTLCESELYSYVLDKAVELTSSKIGFFHLVSDDQKNIMLTQWNDESLNNCTTPYEVHYSIDIAGNWVDCVRQRQAIIYNDFPNSPNQKGLPPGHTPIERFMSIPVIVNEKVVIIFGVGNKDFDYNDLDKEYLHVVANELYKIIIHRRSARALHKSEMLLRQSQAMARIGSWELDVGSGEVVWTDEIYEIFEVNKEEYDCSNVEFFLGFTDSKHKAILWGALEAILQKGTLFDLELPITNGRGRSLWLRANAIAELKDAKVVRVAGNIMDITELKSALLELENINTELEDRVAKRSDELAKFSLAIEQSPVSVVITDTEARIQYVNPYFTALTGYTLKDVVGQNPRMLNSGRTPRERYADLWKTLTTGHTWHGEFINKKKNGQEFIEEVLISPVKNEQGEVTHFIAVKTDITERRRIEEAVTRAEERYRAMFDNMFSGAIVLVPIEDGEVFIIRDINNPAQILFKTTKETLLGRNCLDVLPGLNTIGLPDKLLQVYQTKQSIYIPMSIYDCDNIHFWMDCFVYSLPSKDIVLILNNITEKVYSETKLQSANEELSRILGAIPTLLIAIDSQDIIVEWNYRAIEIFHVEGKQARGISIHDLNLPWDKDELKKTFGKCREENRSTNLDRLFLNYPDNQLRKILRLSISPISYGSNDEQGLLLIGEDITEYVTMHNQLIQAQKLEAIGQLAAGIAHEINTPIQFVSSNLDFIADSFQPITAALTSCSAMIKSGHSGCALRNAPVNELESFDKIDFSFLQEEIPKALADAQEGLGRVASIVLSIKKFAHPGSDEKQLININDLIENTVTVARNEWKYVAAIELRLDPELPLVYCNPGDINQAVLNILVNAAHAIGDLVKGTAQMGKITITSRKSDLDAEIVISDTGAGIPESIRGKIFDPFFTTKEVGKGTGQGLAIVYNIVKRHGGTISVETEEGKGTSFTIRFPFKQ